MRRVARARPCEAPRAARRCRCSRRRPSRPSPRASRAPSRSVDDRGHAASLPAHLGHWRLQIAIERRIVRKRLEIARDHRERRAQLVRGAGDEVLAHVLEAHLARYIAHQQQVLAFAIRHELHREIVVDLDIGLQDDRIRVLAAVEIAGKTAAGGSGCRSAARSRPQPRRLSRSPAMRLNQVISRRLLRMTTPSGSAAVERWICRTSFTNRCL